MAISYKILGQNTISANGTYTTLYTVPTGKQAIITSIIAISGDAAGSSFNKRIDINAVKSGQTASETVNRIYTFNSVGSQQNYQLTDKLTLTAGESLAFLTDSAGEWPAMCTVFGTEMDI